MVRPTHFSKFLDVHSSLEQDLPDESLGQIHFTTNVAHLKEWPNIFATGVHDKAVAMPPRDFIVAEGEMDLMMHQFKGARYVKRL